MYFENIERLNFQIFALLNASPSPPPSVVLTARIVADYAIYILPVMLAFLWLRGEPQKRFGLVAAFLAAELALLVNQIIPAIWFHPRPFMIPIGNTLVQHAADSSFPSDHVTFMTAVSIGLWVFSRYGAAALTSGLLTVLVAWSRIYLGVHFPMDMVGGVAVGAGGVMFVKPISGWLRDVMTPKLLLPVYRMIFAFPIRKGVVKD